MSLVAALLFVILGAVALLHAYWACGGRWPGQDARSLANIVIGTDTLPGARACTIVAALIALTALWPLIIVRLVVPFWPIGVSWLIGGLLALVFIGRGLAGFTPAWRRAHSRAPFASLDRRFYSPLCLAIGICYLLLLTDGLA